MPIRVRATKASVNWLASISAIALLAASAVASAALVTMSAQVDSFSLSNPQIQFMVVNRQAVNGVITVTNTNTGPQTASQNLAFNRFDGSLGTLTGVSITLNSVYDLSSTVKDSGSTLGSSPTGIYTFFADGTADLSLVGAGLIPAQSLTEEANAAAGFACISFSCVVDTATVSNTGNFNATPVAGALNPFVGTGTFDLTATLLSDLAPKTTPDNGSGFVDNASFEGSLLSRWNGSVSLVYTYDDGQTPGTDIPEPISLYLVFAGLAGLAFWRRHRG